MLRYTGEWITRCYAGKEKHSQKAMQKRPQKQYEKKNRMRSTAHIIYVNENHTGIELYFLKIHTYPRTYTEYLKWVSKGEEIGVGIGDGEKPVKQEGSSAAGSDGALVGGECD